ncbi:rhomboid family intramembrane serine protease [Flavobacterium sp. RHBU_24]|uniref:rhomboid family intramembrane serine protease n=1 Tax=Flavobacterium sp. RHBU_24 TaxID=3391185 RepID=UPI003984C384
MMKITDTVKHLIIINVIFFAATYFIGEETMYNIFALHAPTSDKFQFWQPATHMFMHGSVQHILFNMLGLWMFGSPLDHYWGTNKFLFFYFSCGIGAAALHLGVNYFEMQQVLESVAGLNLSHDTVRQILNIDFIVNNYPDTEIFRQHATRILQAEGKFHLLQQYPGAAQGLFDAAIQNQSPMLGASGALYGVIVAFAFMFPNAELMMIFLPIPIKAKYFVPLLLVGDLFLGLRGQSIFGSQWEDGIAHFAHLGGALIGFIMMMYWRNKRFNHNRWN